MFCRSRVRVHWGDYSVVEATLRLIREALRRPEGYDRLVLLSGADYPIRPLEDLRDHLAAHPEDEFINLVPMPDAEVDKSMSGSSSTRCRTRCRSRVSACSCAAASCGWASPPSGATSPARSATACPTRAAPGGR